MTLFRLLLAASTALLFAACTSAPAPRTATAAPHRPAVLLVSIDGLRADAIDPRIAPNLSRIAGEGVRAQWMTPSYPSLTFPNHYTLVTGLRPDHHGVIHNSMSDGTLGRFKLADRDAVGDARWWGGEPVWVGVEKAGMHAATWSWPGSEAAIQGVRPSRWRPYDARVSLDSRVDDVLDWLADTSPQKPQLVTLYFEQVDLAGHDFGPQSPQYAQAIRQVDDAMGRLEAGIARLGLAGDVDLVIVSDHGMGTVPPGNLVAIEDMVPADVATAVSIGQSVGFAPREGRQQAAEARLLGAHPHYDCWRKQELPARWHYGSHPRIPAIVCQMHEGWDALPADQVARRRAAGNTRGSHGYDPALPSMRAVFIARGPSFKRHQVLPPFDNVDVYPLLTRLLGIPAAANDGNPQTLLPALRDAATTR